MTTLSKNFFSYAGNKKYNKRIVEFGDTNFRSKILSTFIFENNSLIESNMNWSKSKFDEKS